MDKDLVSDKDRVVVAKVGRVHGIQGWVRINSFTEPPENVLNYKDWWILHHNQWQLLEKQASKIQNQEILIKIKNCNNREQAQFYTNDLIAVPRESLPLLSSEEYYWSDLIGMRVMNEQKIDLGIVDHLFSTGSNDVLVLTGEKERLIPYTEDAIKQIDLQNKIITVDWDSEF